MPPPILIKEHGGGGDSDSTSLRRVSDSSPTSCTSTGSSTSGATTVVSTSQYTRHPLHIDTDDKVLRARNHRHRERSYRGVLPVYSMSTMDSQASSSGHGHGHPALPLYSKTVSPTFAQVTHGSSPSPARSMRRPSSFLDMHQDYVEGRSPASSSHSDDTLPVGNISTTAMGEGSCDSSYSKVRSPYKAHNGPQVYAPTPQHPAQPWFDGSEAGSVTSSRSSTRRDLVDPWRDAAAPADYERQRASATRTQAQYPPPPLRRATHNSPLPSSRRPQWI
ncbi:hypothetical protein BDZ90DRAFT_234619 [Jaminaea rosea]|uniref:Uncharacterized protein n=1 Tax=Jaminaea rosea TaxID=1569628 RepID=A0A316UIB2_9BASI|nr:hypothetical protein BDZ90DRAFT_234619 [Jaminaea rosea]PWN25012.1 hypothetical protein BDZ90DRAFT_234619 [Jaminaea rosea]